LKGMFNNNNTEIINLKLRYNLKNKNIITEFYYHIPTKSVIIRLNHKYEPTNIIFKVDTNDWSNNGEKITKLLNSRGVDQENIKLIVLTLDDNWNTIIDINFNNGHSNSDRTYVCRDISENLTNENNDIEKSQANLLVKLFQEKSSSILFKDQFNVPHTLVNIQDHYEVLPIEGTKLKRYLSKIYYDEYERVPNSEAVKNVVQLLESKAFFEGKAITLHLRTAWSNIETKDSVYYDLTDSKNRCVKITADGWKVVDTQTEVLFRKYNHLSSQVEPMIIDNMDTMDGKILDEFMTIFNIKGEDNKLLLKCYIISLFIPDIPKPILLLHGEQGGAKSTIQELIKMLVDPSSIQTLTFPRDSNEFIQQLSHNYIVYYDNISYIQDWISDLLCRAVTGSSFSKRALWTNDDDFYYSFKRNIGINGIDIAATKADLLDRSIIIQTERIDKTDRIKIEKIWEKFDRIRPQVLGSIFNILSKVLRYKNQHGEISFPNGLNRMADWEEYAEIISRCMGNAEGEFQRVYQENIGVQVDEAIDSSPLSMAIIELMADKEEGSSLTETPTELYSKLNEIAESKSNINTSKIKSWPKSASYLSRRINGIKTNLREKGIEITLRKDEKGKRIITIFKVSSMALMSPNISESSTKQEEKIDGISNNDQVQSKVSSNENPQVRTQNPSFATMDSMDGTLHRDEKGSEKLTYQEGEHEEDIDNKYGIRLGTKSNLPIHKITKKQFDSLSERSKKD